MSPPVATGSCPHSRLRAAVLSGLLLFAVLGFAFLCFLHHCCEGLPWVSFLPGSHFGVPSQEALEGVRPVTEVGWDGQFYYYASNDLLARSDAAKHMDAPAYRYQRIGLPLLARAASVALGHGSTSPTIYHGLHLAVVAAAFGVLVYWLMGQGVSPYFALAWPMSGLAWALFHGLPDPAGDAFFVFAAVALLSRRLLLYAAAATVLCLVREGYVAFVGPVFLLTCVGWVRWDGGRNWLVRAAATALPGVATVGWMLYLCAVFHEMPFHTQRMVPPGTMTDYPFFAFFRNLAIHWHQGYMSEVWFKLVVGAVLAILLCRAAWNARSNSFALAALPYLLLTCALGNMVWEDASAYLKAFGTAVLVGIFLLPQDRSWLLRFALLAAVYPGTHYVAKRLLRHPPHYSALAAVHPLPKADPTSTQRQDPTLEPLAKVELLDLPESWPQRYHGLFSPLHREAVPPPHPRHEHLVGPVASHAAHGQGIAGGGIPRLAAGSEEAPRRRRRHPDRSRGASGRIARRDGPRPPRHRAASGHRLDDLRRLLLVRRPQPGSRLLPRDRGPVSGVAVPRTVPAAAERTASRCPTCSIATATSWPSPSSGSGRSWWRHASSPPWPGWAGPCPCGRRWPSSPACCSASGSTRRSTSRSIGTIC